MKSTNGSRQGLRQVRDGRPVQPAQTFGTIVRAASTGNVNPTGAATLDGVVLATGDLVLLWRQTVAGDKGVYKVNTSGVWKYMGQFPLVIISEGDLQNGGGYFLESENSYQPLVGFWG